MEILLAIILGAIYLVLSMGCIFLLYYIATETKWGLYIAMALVLLVAAYVSGMVLLGVFEARK